LEYHNGGPRGRVAMGKNEEVFVKRKKRKKGTADG
jgi:hypothetical protein